MKYVVDGIHYQVDTWGKGFPLLLLHGFTGDLTTWNIFRKDWQEHSKAIALDIIGHGQTDAPEPIEMYHIEAAAHALNSLLDQMDIPRVDVLGYSMGGRLALTFAIKYPNRVRKLILESASPGLDLAEEREARVKQDANMGMFIRQKGIEEFVDYWEEIPLFHSQKKLSVQIRSQIREQRLQNSQIGLSNSLIGMGTGSMPSWWDELSAIEAQVLLLTGELDQKFVRIAEKMSKRLKNGKWITVENCGHAIHVEKPEKFGTIISEFLNGSVEPKSEDNRMI